MPSDDTASPTFWYWATSEDADVWLGPHATCEEAISSAVAEDGWEDDKADPDEPRDQAIYLVRGRPAPLNDNPLEADHVLDLWHDLNEEVSDEGNLQMAPTAEQKADLAGALNRCFADWRFRYSLGEAFKLDVRESRSIPLADVNG